jgi:hypothetical protein
MNRSHQRALAGLALASALACSSTREATINNQVIEQLAQQLESAYVFPDIGQRYADVLRAEQESHFSKLDPGELAAALTARLQSVHADGHLRVEGPHPELLEPTSTESNQTQGQSPPIEAAQWLAPDVAYLRANLFPCNDPTVDAVARFMWEHAGAGTLILDVRGHRGGGLAEIDVVFSELFAEETLLLYMETRKSVDESGGSPIKDGATVRRVAAPEGVVRRAHLAIPANTPRFLDAHVYVLTSGYTASAAEHLALSLKRTGRGVVVGEATRGGAHFGGTALLGEGFSAFVPVGRTYDPDTGADWEGVGVSPDIPVDPKGALIAVLIDCGLDAVEARRIDAQLGFVPPPRP